MNEAVELRALKTPRSWKSVSWQGSRVLGRAGRLSLTATLPMRGAFCSIQLSLQPQGERMNLCGGHFFLGSSEKPEGLLEYFMWR